MFVANNLCPMSADQRACDPVRFSGCRPQPVAVRAVVSRRDPVEAAAQQAAGVGAHHQPLLPQLGDLHPSDVDADLLQPGAAHAEPVAGLFPVTHMRRSLSWDTCEPTICVLDEASTVAGICAAVRLTARGLNGNRGCVAV